MYDNMTVGIYINNIRGIKSASCNKITCSSIWKCIFNKEADKQSIILDYATDWELNPELFINIHEHL